MHKEKTNQPMFSMTKDWQLHFRGHFGEQKSEIQLNLHLFLLIWVLAQIIHTVPTAEGAYFYYRYLLYHFTKYLYEMFEVFDHM